MLSCGVFTFWFTEPKVNQKVVKFVAVYSDNYDETMQTKRTGLSSNSWCLSHPTGGASTAHLCAFGLDLPMFDAIVNQNVRCYLESVLVY